LFYKKYDLVHRFSGTSFLVDAAPIIQQSAVISPARDRNWTYLQREEGRGRGIERERKRKSNT
jgi:hypothetical protein